MQLDKLSLTSQDFLYVVFWGVNPFKPCVEVLLKGGRQLYKALCRLSRI